MTRHRGGALGTLVVLVAIAVAGYYAYKYFVEAEDAPSCKAQLNRCIAACRQNSTEAPQVEACQRKCEQDADACQQKR